MRSALRSAVVRMVALLLPASFAIGQEINLRTGAGTTVQVAGRTAPDTYGTASSAVYTIWSVDFQLFGDPTDEGATEGNTGGRRCGLGSCAFIGTAHLPSGANISGIELEACDNSSTSQLQFFLFRGVSPGQTVQFLTPPAGTGIAETPGCAVFPLLSIPHTVDNNANAYAVDVIVPADTNIILYAVRVHYNLQVSPAPVAATFNDVPTGHPQFQFIEALVASGVTAGCGGGNYCPDATLTRGQMAVFLAKALGLHFPN